MTKRLGIYILSSPSSTLHTLAYICQRLTHDKHTCTVCCIDTPLIIVCQPANTCLEPHVIWTVCHQGTCLVMLQTNQNFNIFLELFAVQSAHCFKLRPTTLESRVLYQSIVTHCCRKLTWPLQIWLLTLAERTLFIFQNHF